MTGAFQAVVERDVRRFVRNPRLVAAAILLPILELIVVGQTIGGKIRDVPLAVVDQDGGPAAIGLIQRLLIAESAARTAKIHREPDLDRALREIRAGRIAGAIVIPPGYSSAVLAGDPQPIGLVLDNADLLVMAHLEANLAQIAMDVPEERAADWMLDIVEPFPFVDYTQYLTPGAIALAIYITCLLGGGILYVDDRVRGVHEGYLATPATSLELAGGMAVAGALKAVACSAAVAVVGVLYAGLASRLNGKAIALTVAITIVSAFALSGLITALSARIRDVFLSRVLVAALNLLFLLPSGAIWPVSGFPEWMRAVSRADPFTYMVHAYRTVLLREASWDAVVGDLGVLSGFAACGLLAAWAVFPRRL